MVLTNPLNSSPEASLAPTYLASSIDSQLSPWLTPIAYGLGCWCVIPLYFRVQISGQEHLPQDGAVILAPTHRSRWDALLIPYAAGRFATGRDIRFMVTSDEVKGVQGWFIRHLGGFPVNPRQPAIASLRYGLEVLQNREMLVIFPEGGIFRDKALHPLKPGLARLALQAASSQPDLNIQVVPIHLDYSQMIPTWGCKVDIRIGAPLQVTDYHQGTVKSEAQRLTADLATALERLTVNSINGSMDGSTDGSSEPTLPSLYSL